MEHSVIRSGGYSLTGIVHDGRVENALATCSDPDSAPGFISVYLGVVDNNAVFYDGGIIDASTASGCFIVADQASVHIQ